MRIHHFIILLYNMCSVYSVSWDDKARWYIKRGILLCSHLFRSEASLWNCFSFTHSLNNDFFLFNLFQSKYIELIVILQSFFLFFCHFVCVFVFWLLMSFFVCLSVSFLICQLFRSCWQPVLIFFYITAFLELHSSISCILNYRICVRFLKMSGVLSSLVLLHYKDI